MAKILLIITGGISAYKAADIASFLRKRGDEISIVMTEAAQQIITPLTLESVSGGKVYTDMWKSKQWGQIDHIALARAHDAILIAPATYNFTGKVALGIADDLASTLMAATDTSCLWAPAMNSVMYQKPQYQKNQAYLESLGHIFIEPAEGMLACGETGKGRLASLDDIIEQLDILLLKKLEKKQDFQGKTVLITAGPTVEKIDAVRFISNSSSGKMGYHIAQDIISRGGKVILISGPVHLKPPQNLSVFRATQSAQDMYDAVFDYYDHVDIAISVAAVADYTPLHPRDDKIKKNDNDLSLELTRTKDILAQMGQQKKKQFLVGFAAESHNGLENAYGKLQRKNLDMIILNHVSAMQKDDNEITILGENLKVDLPQMTKEQTAIKINDTILKQLKDLIFSK